MHGILVLMALGFDCQHHVAEQAVGKLLLGYGRVTRESPVVAAHQRAGSPATSYIRLLPIYERRSYPSLELIARCVWPIIQEGGSSEGGSRVSKLVT